MFFLKTEPNLKNPFCNLHSI